MTHELTPTAPRARRAPVRDDLAYLLPMLTFLAFTWAGATWKDLYVATYATKALVVAVMLYLFWPAYTRVRWNGWWLGAIVGVVGIFQWVGMQRWLQESWPAVVEGMTFVPTTARQWLANHFKPGPDVFDPTKVFTSPVALYSFYALRICGAVLVVPVMEELFWRDFLWRTVISPNDFKLAQVGEWDWRAFAVVCVAFSFVHGNWWLTSIVWAAMVGALLVYTKSLGACIVAHAVTNLLLAVYVLRWRDWAFW
jgi:CAAX prenyl protease-like protein